MRVAYACSHHFRTALTHIGHREADTYKADKEERFKHADLHPRLLARGKETVTSPIYK